MKGKLLTKIRKVMQGAILALGATGALVVGQTNTAHASTVSVPAAEVSADVQGEEPVTTMTLRDCTNYLEAWGYNLTRARVLACSSMTVPLVPVPVKLAGCTAALINDGVGRVVAPLACTAGLQ
jgi:hypothetical protein